VAGHARDAFEVLDQMMAELDGVDTQPGEQVGTTPP
jgi:hypothetical protein